MNVSQPQLNAVHFGGFASAINPHPAVVTSSCCGHVRLPYLTKRTAWEITFPLETTWAPQVLHRGQGQTGNGISRAQTATLRQRERVRAEMVEKESNDGGDVVWTQGRSASVPCSLDYPRVSWQPYRQLIMNPSWQDAGLFLLSSSRCGKEPGSQTGGPDSAPGNAFERRKWRFGFNALVLKAFAADCTT